MKETRNVLRHCGSGGEPGVIDAFQIIHCGSICLKHIPYGQACAQQGALGAQTDSVLLEQCDLLPTLHAPFGHSGDNPIEAHAPILFDIDG